ncbi:HK97 family phage prohead protease [Mobiluncus mulieris]|uniref:HK97 family phage prohead protease n=1 Tax=Mobiluncus mulieris TaxID=2052 RepID=A0A7Y0Y5H4_9ACTO|nr:HK97 family phage prohead protease [Mobiluncus mulieris]
MRTKYAEALIKTEENGEEQGQFTAYASTFDREPDSYGDVVAKGAFVNTLKEWAESGNIIPVLFGHRMDDPDFNIGAVLHAEEDERGLKIVGQLDLDSPKGMKVYKLIKGRRLSQLSFAFDVLDQASIKLEDGTKANELRELKLYEVSLVPIGANQHTEILAVKDAVRALTESVKAGRVISAKNEETLQTVAASMKEAAAQIESVLAQVSGGEAKGDMEASTPTVAEQVSAAGGVSAAQQNTLKAALEIALALNQGN